MVGGQNPGMVAGGPRTWGEVEVPAEPAGGCFVYMLICRTCRFKGFWFCSYCSAVGWSVFLFREQKMKGCI